MDLLNQNLTPTSPVKTMINVGALFDIPTGTYVEAADGSMVLLGGLTTFSGFVGSGNMFKSTIMRYMRLRAMARMKQSVGSTYDTENNIQEWQLQRQAILIPEFQGEDVIDNGRWVVTDESKYSGTGWYENYKEFLKHKVKNFHKLTVTTPFWNRAKTGKLSIILPTFNEVDSLTRLQTDDVVNMQDKNELGESGANTLHMRQGLAKQRILMQVPGLNAGASSFQTMTAHVGNQFDMQNAGPGGMVPKKQLTAMKTGEKIKGVTEQFLFNTLVCYQMFKVAICAEDRFVTYPRDKNDNLKDDSDLNEVHVKVLRNKSGPSGMSHVVIVSQTEGVLSALTEFHHIRKGKDVNGEPYGLGGSLSNYFLTFYPECKLTKKTVRSKLNEDAKLRRAVNFTSEMYQMSYLWQTQERKYKVLPADLYAGIIEKGYDFDLLLMTRGWWTHTDEEHPVPRLSTLDLIRMHVDEWHPPWYPVSKEQLSTEEGKKKVAAFKLALEPTLGTAI